MSEATDVIEMRVGGDGHWVTINGVHVFIQGGVVKQGPAKFKGKKADELEGEAAASKMPPTGKPPRDYTDDEKQAVAEHYADSHPMSKLRKWQDVNEEQTGRAYAEGNTEALGNLQAMSDVLAAAVDIKQFGKKKRMSATDATGTYYLFATGGEAKPAITLGQALPKTRNSLPCFYYWRQSIADGEYVHPVKKFGLKVDASRRRTWEQNFRRMKDAGEEVPIVEDHADARSNATLGYVVDVWQNGKWYEELHQYLGEKERDTALRNKISIGIDPDFHTGNGVRLGDCIIHSATTPRPVVPGQGEAVPIVASRGPAGDVLELSAARQESTMDLTQLRKALGLADDAPDADVISSATTKLAAVPALETDKATALSRVTAVEAERDAAKAQVLELSRTGNGPDPEVLHERSLRIMDKADSLSAAGILPPAFVDKFKKLLGGDKPRALLLSRDTGAADCPAGEFINLLAEFKPVMQFGEKTGAQQTLVLGRAVYGNAGDAGADEEAKKIDEFMKERQAQRKTT